MKKSFKFLTILFAFILLCGIVAISAMASGEETQAGPADGNYFQVYDIASGSVTKYKDPKNFNSVIQNVTGDSIITLLWNIDTTTQSYISVGDKASSTSPVKIYWDLNGYYCAFVRESTGGSEVNMDIKDYVELNIYSSRQGGRIYNYNQENATEYGALFLLRNTNQALNLGGITVPFEFDYTNGTYTANKSTTYDGKNLSTYSAALVNVTHDTTYDQNIKVNIKGGTYSQNSTYKSALITCSSDATGAAAASVNVTDATLVSTYGNIFNTEQASNASSPTGSVSFDRCVIYSTLSVMGTYHNTLALEFKDCRFAGNIGSFHSSIAFDNCKLSGNAVFSAKQSKARINQVEKLDILSCEFAYKDDGTVDPASYETFTTSINAVYGWQTLTDESSCATIVWDAEAILGEGEKITETWLVGETPISPIPIPEATSVYRYTFPGVTEIKEATTTTYILTGYASFGIKANLELSEKFAFNIYVPAEVWSSVNPESIKIGSTDATAEETTIDGKDYYILTHSINANKAYEVFTLEIELIGYKGKAFTHFYTFSIPDYIDKIQEGGYTQEAKTLMDATENYIAAVDNFANNGTNEINVTYSPTKVGNTSGVTALESVQLVLGEAITIRFNADTAVAMTLVLPCQNGTSTSTREVTVSESDWSGSENTYYYDVTLPVKFLNDGITVTVGNQSGIFYLDDYINWVKNNEADNDDLVTLVNAIGAYSAAAKAYAQSEGNQTPVVKFTVAGNEITQIVYNGDAAEAAANALKTIIEAKSGTTITVTKDTAMAATENAILLSITEPNAAYDYEIKVDGTNLVINCSFKSFVQKATELFINDCIQHSDKNVNFATDFEKDYYTDKIYYSDFGAAGNAEISESEGHTNTDDFEALKATHDFANATKRHAVYADAGAAYYIHETRAKGTGAVQTISVKTDVDWGNAQFIIDDSNISIFDGTGLHNGWIFKIESDYTDFDVVDAEKLASLRGIGEKTTKLEGLDLPYPAMLTIYNDNHKVYRRNISGVGGEGSPQHEVILVDKDGYVDRSTPFMFDYAEVTKYTVHRTDVEPITIKGGSFTTIASSVNIYNAETNTYPGDGYLTRGIKIMRPYTVLDGVEHYVTGEIPLNEQTKENCGVAYNGFFFVENTNDVLLKDLVLTGRRCYAQLNRGEQGTYDFDASGANNIRLEGCIQSNFYMQANADTGVTTTYKQTNPDGSITFGVEVDVNGEKQRLPGFTVTKDANGTPTVTQQEGAVLSMSKNPKLNETGTRICWGIGGSNFCKNMEYINSVLSRYDAHAGLLNGKVVGTTINCFALVGKGDFLIEDVTWISATADETYQVDNSFIYLRGDYGSPWEGTITIRDTEAHNAGRSVWLIYHYYVNWDFGYTCYFPNIVIDNLEFTNADTVKFLYQNNWSDNIHKDTYNSAENANKVVPPEFIKIINNKSGETYNIPYNKNFFSTTYIAIDTNGNTIPENEYHTEYDTTETKEEDSPIISMN